MRFVFLAIAISTGGFLGALFLPEFQGRTLIGARIYAAPLGVREWARRQSVSVKIVLVLAVGTGGLTVLWWPFFAFGNYKPFGEMLTGGTGNIRLVLAWAAAAAVAKVGAKYL